MGNGDTEVVSKTAKSEIVGPWRMGKALDLNCVMFESGAGIIEDVKFKRVSKYITRTIP